MVVYRVVFETELTDGTLKKAQRRPEDVILKSKKKLHGANTCHLNVPWS